MNFRFASTCLAIGTTGLLACGGGSDSVDTVDPNGTDTQFVADTVSLPASSAQAMQLALDLDGDDIADNALGQNLSILASQGVDLQGALDEAVDSGAIIVLNDIQATALDNATGVGTTFYLGENPSPAACTDPNDITTCGQHLNGDASFDVSADSPSDALVIGQLVGGGFETTVHGDVKLQLSIIAGSPPIELNLIGARTAYQVSADGTTLSNGRLGGAITEQEARDNLLPVIAGFVMDIVTRDCTGDPGSCCDAGSTGETLLDIFDPDSMDCVVSADEVENNDLVSTILSPDLDLLDENGNFNPNSDDTNDSISVGLGFTAVGATFTKP